MKARQPPGSSMALPSTSARVLSNSAAEPRSVKPANKRWQPPEGLAPEEIGAIIDAAATERDQLLLTTLWATGARISEVLTLRPRDIHRDGLVLPNLKNPSRLVKTAHLSERLVLRQFMEDDLDNLFELDSDPDVMRFINGGRPTPLEEVRNEILPTYLRPSRIPGCGTWVAIERSSGGFLGWFGFRPPKDGSTDDPELGYRLRKSGWGKGYATEGSRALIRKGFREYGVRRVFATTMTVNIASRRVMEKAGLKFVRTFFSDWPDYIEGAEHGDVEYALYREEWEST